MTTKTRTSQWEHRVFILTKDNVEELNALVEEKWDINADCPTRDWIAIFLSRKLPK